jgi:hypothetical protein
MSTRTGFTTEELLLARTVSCYSCDACVGDPCVAIVRNGRIVGETCHDKEPGELLPHDLVHTSRLQKAGGPLL